jgi:hypothetical protein
MGSAYRLQILVDHHSSEITNGRTSRMLVIRPNGSSIVCVWRSASAAG